MIELNHPCIVKLYGISRGESLMMVTSYVNLMTSYANEIYLKVQELVAMGSALDYILDYPMAVGLTDFKLWAAQIASGMTYLESKGLV